jgi:hypothetical protein
VYSQVAKGAGNVATIYGERAVGDPGAVSARPLGTRAAANSADPNLPEVQALQGFNPKAAPPPSPSAPQPAGKSGFLGSLVAQFPLFNVETPPGTPVPNPSFSSPNCPDGKAPPCPMMLNENTPSAGAITDFVDYGPIDNPAFTRPSWWQFWKDSEQVSPDDIHQGAVGDCFLLASLAAIASKQPDVIRHLLKLNKKTLSSWINFWDGTPPKPVFVGPVDNLFPVWKKGVKSGDTDLSGQSAFAKPVGGAWPLIVEKAYAIKFTDDSYAELNQGGSPSPAMTRITGKPSHWFIVDTKDDRFKAVPFKDLAQWDGNGEPIVVQTKAKPKGDCPTSTPAAAQPAGAAAAPPADSAAGPKTDPAEDTDSVCTDPLYKGKVVCTEESKDPVCQGKIVQLAMGHAYWVKSVDAGSESVTLANPWGADQPTVTWPWSRLQKSLLAVNVNEESNNDK